MNFRSFESQVLYFNSMYKLPAPPLPTISAVVKDERNKLLAQDISEKDKVEVQQAAGPVLLIRRLTAFKETLLKEVKEGDEIIEKLQVLLSCPLGEEPIYTVEDLLTELADWLGDIQVYCASEMAKFGLPNSEVLRLIMNSNFSKLQLDGSVKYDANGKVEKGPLYWKPEPSIKALIMEVTEEQQRGK